MQIIGVLRQRPGTHIIPSDKFGVEIWVRYNRIVQAIVFK